jgi:predicted acyltransferase
VRRRGRSFERVRHRTTRLRSLDVLRGLAIAAMIVVNNPGDWSAVFPQLLHAYWFGLTAADVIFPAFVFVMGAATALSIAAAREHQLALQTLYTRLVRRVVLLIALNLVLNAVSAWPNVWPLRVPGVLQRIAIAHLVTALVVLHLPPPRRWFVIAGLLVGHWALLTLVPFDGQPAGTLTPERNLARYIDTLVFGRHALTIPNDPEGLLGTLTAAATALLGAAAGEWIRGGPGNRARPTTLTAAGVVGIVIGLGWSVALPLSKPLWTGSFVLVTAGVTTVVLAMVSRLVDVGAVTRWSQPFVWLGVNAIAVYVGSEMVGDLLEGSWLSFGFGRTSPKAWVFWELLNPAFPSVPLEWLSLAMAMVYLTLWMAIAGVLWRFRVRVRV